jgi:hypothetical protein
MFVIFNNSVVIAAFIDQKKAIDYWRIHGGTIVLYPDLTADTIHIEA